MVTLDGVCPQAGELTWGKRGQLAELLALGGGRMAREVGFFFLFSVSVSDDMVRMCNKEGQGYLTSVCAVGGLG